MSYDALGRLLHEQDALGKSEYYSYDPAGNLVMLTNGDGQTAYYSFDAANRLTAIAFPDGAAPSFSYDAASRLTSAYQSSPPYESDSFEYDAAGRVIARTNWATGGTLYFQYDLAGRRTALADPKGGVVYYTYDKRGLITRVDASWGSTFYTFDARGALLTRHLPNNSCTYYTYDAPGRLTKLEDRWDDGQTIQTFEFARDPNGNITRSLREDASCWYYDYDGLQRLTAADWKDAGGSTLYAFEYAYDKVGNRLRFAQNGVSTYYWYNEANELLNEVIPGAETAYYTYDGRGNQITRSVLGGHTTYFGYNSRNLISSISSTDPTFTPNYFEYNALGQRIKKVDSTGTTRYLWDGLNILLELDQYGALKRRYTHGYTPIEGVSSLIAVQGTMQCPCFYHFDQVGGVRHLTDPYGNTIKSYAYEPFGRILAESGSAPNDFTFPACSLRLADLKERLVSATRLYDASTGSFGSRDGRIRMPTYVGAAWNPLRFVDPTGRVEWDINVQACRAIMYFKIRIEWRGAWTPARQSLFQSKMRYHIARAFNNSGFRIRPSSANYVLFRFSMSGVPAAVCPRCPCWPAGFIPNLAILFVTSGGADWTPYVTANPTRIDYRTWSNLLDEADVPAGPGLAPSPIQVTVVHEFGHAIGLEHPGWNLGLYEPNSPGEYRHAPADWLGRPIGPGDLMGLGIALRPFYFAAWKDRLNSSWPDCGFDTA
jgi:YD repeat-containing protein